MMALRAAAGSIARVTGATCAPLRTTLHALRARMHGNDAAIKPFSTTCPIRCNNRVVADRRSTAEGGSRAQLDQPLDQRLWSSRARPGCARRAQPSPTRQSASVDPTTRLWGLIRSSGFALVPTAVTAAASVVLVCVSRSGPSTLTKGRGGAVINYVDCCHYVLDQFFI